MSLRTFHKIFILSSIVCCAFVAVWASGHNPAGAVLPGVRIAAALGAAALSPYLLWVVRRYR